MPKPNNLIVIMSDEHNPRVIGCYGDPIVRTPTLDSLAADLTLADGVATVTSASLAAAPLTISLSGNADLLQRIGIASAAAGMLSLWLDVRGLVAVTISLLVGYCLLLGLVPVPGVGAGNFAEGMAPKVQACLDAIEAGASAVRIIDGRDPEAFALALAHTGGTLVVA